MSDLVTMAENRLDTLLAADDGSKPPAGDDTPPADDGQQPPAGGDDTPPNGDDPNDKPNGDDPDGQNGDDPQNQPPQDGEENADKDKKPADDAGKPKADEAPKELSDDELMAELEKRGLKVQKKDDPDQQKPQAPQIPKPEELPESVWGGMKPVQRYIYNELPYINIKGTDAEGNEVEMSIKTPDQIPRGFKFADTRDEKIADDAFIEQNRKADTMYKSIQQNSQQAQERQAQQAENEAIIAGIEQLQADGVVPKIVAKPGTPEFDKDPGVIRANQILEYRQKILQSGENVSVVSAGKMFKADNPDLYVVAPKPPVESAADKERKEKSKNISGGGRGTPSEADKSEKTNARTKYPVGMSAQDIADLAGKDLD